MFAGQFQQQKSGFKNFWMKRFSSALLKILLYKWVPHSKIVAQTLQQSPEVDIYIFWIQRLVYLFYVYFTGLNKKWNLQNYWIIKISSRKFKTMRYFNILTFCFVLRIQ